MTTITAARTTQPTTEISASPVVGCAALSQMAHAVARSAAYPARKASLGSLGVSLGRFIVTALGLMCCVGRGISTRKRFSGSAPPESARDGRREPVPFHGIEVALAPGRGLAVVGDAARIPPEGRPPGLEP